MAFEFDLQTGLAASLVTLLVASVFVYFAARFVLDRTSILASFLTVLVGTLLAALVAGLVGGTLGLVLSIATWALVAALFFRTQWVKGAIIGLIAWVLWFLVNLVIGWLF